MLNYMKNSFVFVSILYILLGGAILIWPGSSLELICLLVGFVIMLYGAVKIFSAVSDRERKSRLVGGILFGAVLAGIGVYLIIRPRTILSILPVVIGIFIVLNGLTKIQKALELKKAGYHKWWSFLLAALVTEALGILIISNPFSTVKLTFMVVGLVMVTDGIANIVTILFTSHMQKKMTKERNPETFGQANHVAEWEVEEMVEEIIKEFKNEE